jgi:alpha-L-fucosidase 2
MNHTDTSTSYERYQDLEDSTVGVYYVKNGTAYSREYISSYPDDVVAVHIASNVSGAVSFQVHLRRGEAPSLNRWEDYSAHVSDNTIVINGQSASHTGIEYASGAKVIASGGRVHTLGDTILCDNADEATIYYTAWTGFRKQDPTAAVESQLASFDKTYGTVRESHVSDYQALAGRVSFSLGNSSQDQNSMTTAGRVRALNAGKFDPQLMALYFQFGRYLLISSSRLGTLPANLQGYVYWTGPLLVTYLLTDGLDRMWNYDPDPMWGAFPFTRKPSLLILGTDECYSCVFRLEIYDKYKSSNELLAGSRY